MDSDKKINIFKTKLKSKFKTKFKNVSNAIIYERKFRNDYEDLDEGTNICSRNNSITDLIDQRTPNDDANINHKVNENINDKNLSTIYNEQYTNPNESLEFFRLNNNLNHNNSTNVPNTNIRNPLRSITRGNIWLSLYTILYAGYLILGSIAFMMIESPIEEELRTFIENKKEIFLMKYPQIQDNDLEDFLAAVVKANDRGISPLRNVTNELNWGFGQSLFFSSTIVTTIGYGHVTPLSQTGKIFCIIYATVGIPLTLVLLTAVIERLLIPANWLLGKLNSALGHLYQPFNIRLLHLTIIVAIVATIFVVIPTAIFAYVEPEWGTLDSLYYCFITLTTIGLGDYIPGEGVDPDNLSLYKICIAIYLICGLIAVMFCLTVFYDIPQLNLGQLFTENGTGETEKLRLSGNAAPCYSGPTGLYIPQQDEERRAVVRIRPHGNDESPSPSDEQPTTSTVIQSDIRVP